MPSTIVKFLQLILFPVKGIHFLSDYLALIHRVAILREPSLLRALYCLLLLELFTVLRFALLASCPLSYFQRALCFDGFFLLIPKGQFNYLPVIGMLFLVLYNSYALLLDADYKLVLLLYRILCCTRRGCLCEKRHLRRYFLVILNLLQSLVFVVGEWPPFPLTQKNPTES